MPELVIFSDHLSHRIIYSQLDCPLNSTIHSLILLKRSPIVIFHNLFNSISSITHQMNHVSMTWPHLYILIMVTDLVLEDLGEEKRDIEEPLPVDFEYLGPLTEGDVISRQNIKFKIQISP